MTLLSQGEGQAGMKVNDSDCDRAEAQDQRFAAVGPALPIQGPLRRQAFSRPALLQKPPNT